MAEHNELGKKGEQLAAEYLIENQYEILERNWVFDKAEIDIIAKKDNLLIVVEVKTRSSLEFGLPQDFVKPKKIQLLVKAINQYVETIDYEPEIRFDIIAISKVCSKYNIEHIEDAFCYFKLNI